MDVNLQRKVEPELLDALAADDPQSLRSRKDLRRIQRAMATLSIVRHALNRATTGFVPRTLLELGAGDGSLMLRLAQKQAACWPAVEVTLLDRTVTGLARSYGDAPVGTLLAIVGSSGRLEIAQVGGDAAGRLGLGEGDPMTVRMLD